MEYRKNQTLTVSIEDIGNNGEGIGRHEGYTLFVKDAVAGDVVRAKITKVKSSYAYAICEEVIKRSENRVTPLCRVYKSCGGCQIQAMSYASQIGFKENKVRNNLIRIGEIPEEKVNAAMEKMIASKEPFRYRNKSQYPVGAGSDNRCVAGFYAGRTHNIIPCSDCLLSPEENSVILKTILDHMEEHHILPYNENDKSGCIRHVLIRKGFATGQIMVCLVIKNDNENASVFANYQEELAEKLWETDGMRSFCVSVNNRDTNVIMGRQVYTVRGSDTIEDMILGKRFCISALSFYQVNHDQTENLYKTAIEFADLSGTEEVLDICCGIGTISICMADHAAHVYGIEIVPEAVEDAKKNAMINGTGNVDFICAAAEDFLPQHKDDIKADVIVFDPPRKGMDEKSLEAVVRMEPGKIVYISCDSATLARDLKYLRHHGYEIRKIRCVDLFSQTVHVETVCFLTRE